MSIRLHSLWADIHGAHRDPFGTTSRVHGHLWRVRGSCEQTLPLSVDARDLNTQVRNAANCYDHADLGRMATEDIAAAILGKLEAWIDQVEVEEVGVCLVVVTR